MSKTLRLPNCDEQALLDQFQLRLVVRAEVVRFIYLVDVLNYLVILIAVGDRF
jgi:hypothetical protein